MAIKKTKSKRQRRDTIRKRRVGAFRKLQLYFRLSYKEREFLHNFVSQRKKLIKLFKKQKHEKNRYNW